jgi:hypothetical protein
MTMESDPRLTERDARAVDAVFEAGIDVDATPSADVDADRIERVRAVVALLGHLPDEESADDLVDRTLGRIQQSIDDEERRRRLDEQVGQLAGGPIRTRWSIHLRELAAAAAVVLIGISVIWPFLNRDPALNWDQGDSMTAGMSGLIAAPRREAVQPVFPPTRQNATQLDAVMVADLTQLLGPNDVSFDQPQPTMMSQRWIDRVYRDQNGNTFRIRWMLVPAGSAASQATDSTTGPGATTPVSGP